MAVTVEKYVDARYAKPRYRLRHDKFQTHLRGGFLQGSYKLKRDADLHADELNYGHYGARAKRDSHYSFVLDRTRWAVTFRGKAIGLAVSIEEAYILAGEYAERRVSIGDLT